jgi:hypothetical protein
MRHGLTGPMRRARWCASSPAARCLRRGGCHERTAPDGTTAAGPRPGGLGRLRTGVGRSVGTQPPGAIIANGNLYCPCTPRTLLELGPLPPGAARKQATAHDAKTAELARYKLGRITRDDPDGYHRVQCPAAMGKIRCPLRPASMTLDRDRPEILTPPEHPQACCTQQTITVPPDVLAKTLRTQSAISASPLKSA